MRNRVSPCAHHPCTGPAAHIKAALTPLGNPRGNLCSWREQRGCGVATKGLHWVSQGVRGVFFSPFLITNT